MKMFLIFKFFNRAKNKIIRFIFRPFFKKSSVWTFGLFPVSSVRRLIFSQTKTSKNFFFYKLTVLKKFYKIKKIKKKNFLQFFTIFWQLPQNLPTFYGLNASLNLLFSLYFSSKFLARRLNHSTYYFYKNTFGDGYYFIKGLILIFFIDATLTDDEPLWEPIEWSLVQTWILFIFIFAWIAENLITSRFGSYTGRDKRIWFAWYKTFWLIDLSYVISYVLAALFVIVPFYYEITYSLSFVISWWNWYSKNFFFRFVSMFSLLIVFSNLLLINIRWLNWKTLIFFVGFINVLIAYLLYTHFIISFFGYFTDVLWYQKSRTVDLIQLSHEPLKWGWGTAGRDHFPYHKVTTVFWFKNDGPFAGAFLMIHLFLFLTIFFLNLYWVVLFRKILNSNEVTYTFTVFCVSALRQFFLFFLLLYVLVFMSFIVSYWRFPIEFMWALNTRSWVSHFLTVVFQYYTIFFN